jgi:lipopolysaccharide biosynthesis protein
MQPETEVRFIAYYLPQFHPIPENDQAWGKGFTEWTNVQKAKPLFKGHHQPFVPTELGYYDLRNADVREKQAALAKAYGIEGFCYWHYWMGNGKRLLELPFNEVIKSGKPDFPFCLCWANHTWSKRWVGGEREIIVEQIYPGEADMVAHFNALLPAFKDRRYIKVNGKLLFSIFSPKEMPDIKAFTDLWRQLAKDNELGGFYFVGIGVQDDELASMGLDGTTPHTPHYFLTQIPSTLLDKLTYRVFKKSWIALRAEILKMPLVFNYASFAKAHLRKKYSLKEHPAVLPNWDHSPRSAKKAIVLKNANKDDFALIVAHAVQSVAQRPFEERLIFIKAWNEWAEGNFLEPEQRYGKSFLEVIKSVQKAFYSNV